MHVSRLVIVNLTDAYIQICRPIHRSRDLETYRQTDQLTGRQTYTCTQSPNTDAHAQIQRERRGEMWSVG